MRRVRVTACFGFAIFWMFLSASVISRQPLQARDAQSQTAPSASISVTVKMIDLVDSATDPAGKQYRATVTKLVNAGNGMAAPQGSAAVVTLAQAPNGWIAQLTSLTIGGQTAPVTSVSVNVTSSAQGAAANAANAVGSVFGGFGRHAPPAAVTAVASGQRVILPPGISLTFVLAAAPSPSSTVDAASPPAAPVAAAPPAAPATVATPAAPARPPIPGPASPATSAAQTPTTAATSSNGAGGQLTAMEICFSNPPPFPSDPKYKTEYLTAAFEVPVNTLGAVPAIEPAFSAYLKTTYNYPSAGITCQPIWTITDAQQAQKKIANDRDTAKLKMVNTGWRYGQPPLAAGQSGFDPLAQGPGGLDLSQHRLTTYFCTLVAPGGTTMARPPGPVDETAYISPIFQADWDSATVSMAYNLYIRDHYVHDLNLSDLSPRCGAQSPAMQAMMHQNAGVSKLIGHKVAVDWTYTAAQAAEARTAESAEAAHTAAQQAPTAAANQNYVWCHSAWAGTAGTPMPPGTVMYFSDVFAAVTLPQQQSSGKAGNGGAYINAVAAFQTPYFAFLQKKYGYNPNSNYPVSCSISDPPTVAGLQNAQKNKQQFEDLAKQNRGQIVETGWKSQ